jgi:hypothetical protein
LGPPLCGVGLHAPRGSLPAAIGSTCRS